MAITKLQDYPIFNANRIESVIEITGPTSYATVVNANPPTGGQSIAAKAFGMNFVEFAEGSISDDGQFGVEISFGGPFGPVKTIYMLWFVAATGAQVAATTNLSARHVRIRAIGR